MSDTYKYKRFMRDGSVKEVTAVIRQKRRGKKMRKLNEVEE